jgi:GT2 family glycosyltransferase
LGHAFPKLRGEKVSAAGETVLSVDYAAACSLLVNADALRECGLWEDVFIHFDDIEWGLRVGKAGWRNCATTASTVVHPEFDPEKSGAWICYFDSRNQLWLAEKYGSIHVLAAKIKDWLKNVRAVLCFRHRERIAYRRLAHADFKSGIRRTRSEAIAAVSGGG